MSVRKDRIESIIKREIAPAILNKLNDPSLKSANVTDVVVTNDLSFATIYVSFLNDNDKKKGIQALIKAKGLLRTEVSRALSTRRTPDLIFKLDESSEYGSKIDTLLTKLNSGNK